MPDFEARDLEEILAATAHLWPELRGERIFLAGGTGFLGSWLTQSFAYANARLNLNAKLVVLTRLPRVSIDAAIQYHTGDVTSFDFPSGAFSHILHAANHTAPSPGLAATIVDGTQRMIEFAGTRKLLYLSSGAVYGPQPAALGPIEEDRVPVETADEYALAKRAAEKLCMEASAIIARGFAFLGPGIPLDGRFAAGNFIADFLHGRPIRVASGDAIRSYLYTADFAAWIWTLLFRAPRNSIYNIGSDQPVSILQLAKAISNSIEPGLSSENSFYVPSIQRAGRDFGVAVWTPLEEAIRRTLNAAARGRRERL